MKRYVLAALILPLSACGAPDAPPVPVEETVEPPSDTPMADTPMADAPIGPKSLAGEWRLAGVDGEGFDMPMGVALSITDRRIRFENCQRVEWTYSYAENRFSAERVRLGYPAGTDPATVPPPPCAAPLAPPVQNMVEAIDAAMRAEITPENGVRLSGGGRSITLFSQ